ncbi:MAG: penicillin acylase family protein [Steroidobacteraceae bacterium]
MKNRVLVLLAALVCALPAVGREDLAGLRQQAARVTIVRDDWGIAHVHGRTDADAVFGMIYSQAEDDFNRVEHNYLLSLGRLAGAEGEGAIYQDLRQKLFIDPVQLKTLYAQSPARLKVLMDAWAAGLNYYLATHPRVRPRVIRRFEPWMALSFTEGSIGGDIEKVSTTALQAFYGDAQPPSVPAQVAAAERFVEPSGSNGITISPFRTANGHALLLINPHTSFYFRSELQMSSDEGLNVYGAATWGQFFIYQGFNEKQGWMHTTSGVDVVDEFAEKVSRRDGKLFYQYGAEQRPVVAKTIVVPYRGAGGRMTEKAFTTYSTHHGPIVRAGADGRWIAVALMNKPVEALSQSFLRTKARDLPSFLQVAEQFQANSSNNTLYANADGNTAYLHPQFIPKRDDRFDYTQPVDGADPATDWQGLHRLDERPNVIDPSNGWLQNTNNWPYSVAGVLSPKREAFPRYMDTAGENARGLHALMLLEPASDFTAESLRAAAFDSYLPAFAQLIPPVVKAYDQLPREDALRAKLKEQVELLRRWNYRWGADSVPTALAVFWGEGMFTKSAAAARAAGINTLQYMRENTTPAQKLEALAAASDLLARDFGSWRTPWGEINRFQRLSADIALKYDDAAPSEPVPFVSSQWGSLASFGARRQEGTKRYYGTSGNSFVAVVEFGDRVSAKAVMAGGQSGDPDSSHFRDGVTRYAAGDLREVYFYPDQLRGHASAARHPGE